MNFRSPTLVYFIKPIGMDGPIKIGCSAKPKERILTLAPWVPFPLELLATTPGSFDLERNIQECFAKARLHSEWFHPVPALLAAIQAIAAGAAPGDVIDLSKREGRMRTRIMSAQTKLRFSYSHRVTFAQKRAAKAIGADRYYFLVPDRYHEIMNRWRRDHEYVPSADELAFIEAILAAPLDHLTQHERHPVNWVAVAA